MEIQKFNGQFSEELYYTYFVGIGNENDNGETCNIDFVIYNFNGQTIIATDD